MADVLVVAELTEDGKVRKTTHSAITMAKQALPALGGSFSILVLGANAKSAASELTGFGAAKVIACEDPSLKNYVAEHYAPTVAAVGKGYGLVCATASSFGKDLMPRVAALLGAPQISDVMAVESATRFKRPVYAGNAIATVEAPAGRQLVATVRVASFQAAVAGGQAPVETPAVEAPLPTHTRFVSVTAARSDRPDLQTAARVVSGGRALGSKENFALIQRFADRLGAAIGASRAAVDAGYAPNELQVGQTGKIIAPELYVAIGISGAIQHLTGIKDARTIVAINKDAEAPIFEVADYGLVGDLFTLIPEIEKQLS
jgi:electron transfer flavoprotein alpha subunit